jgi:hypothetical protein
MPAPSNEKADQPRIVVVGKVRDDNKAIWDRHPFHPSNYGGPVGEVFISDMRPFNVHRNSNGIRQKLNEDELTELSDSESQERMDAYNEAQEQRQTAREEMIAAREEVANARTPGVTTVQASESPQPPQGGGYGATGTPANPVVSAPGGTDNPDPNDDGINDPADRANPEVDAASTEQDRTPIRRPNRPER